LSGIQTFNGFNHVLAEVLFALIPLLILFIIFQIFFLKLPRGKLKNMFIGLILTFLGLSLFLQGVKAGFLPVGEAIGIALGSKSYNWIVIPIGFALGFVATLAEPAVRILIFEVEKASSGYIPQQIILYTLSLGVGVAVSASMFRILLGLPLWYFIAPGYLIALLLTRFSNRTFVSIAFDSGGVATGPMTVTFVMAMAIGVANSIEGRDPMLVGFGMIALVALTPILSVLLLGILYSRKEKENERKFAAKL
jgi:hypothetical protein